MASAVPGEPAGRPALRRLWRPVPAAGAGRAGCSATAEAAEPAACLSTLRLAEAVAADPVPRFRRHLIDDGICSDDELNGIDEGALISVEESLKAVLSAETPSAEELDRDVYATPIRYPV